MRARTLRPQAARSGTRAAREARSLPAPRFVAPRNGEPAPAPRSHGEDAAPLADRAPPEDDRAG